MTIVAKIRGWFGKKKDTRIGLILSERPLPDLQGIGLILSERPIPSLEKLMATEYSEEELIQAFATVGCIPCFLNYGTVQIPDPVAERYNPKEYNQHIIYRKPLLCSEEFTSIVTNPDKAVVCQGMMEMLSRLGREDTRDRRIVYHYLRTIYDFI